MIKRIYQLFISCVRTWLARKQLLRIELAVIWTAVVITSEPGNTRQIGVNVDILNGSGHLQAASTQTHRSLFMHQRKNKPKTRHTRLKTSTKS